MAPSGNKISAQNLIRQFMNDPIFQYRKGHDDDRTQLHKNDHVLKKD